MEEVNTALKFIIIPTETIKGISISFVEETIALGGVAIGIINAQLAVKTIGNDIKMI